MKKLFKKTPLKKSFLRRSRYLFFIKNNKKNIINYGSFLKKFDFYFFYFFYFNLNFFFFKNFLNLVYLSFKKKPNYFFYKFFFFNFFKNKNITKNFFNFTNSGLSIDTKESNLNFFFRLEDSKELLDKLKKKWATFKFFFFGNSYFSKSFLGLNDFFFKFKNLNIIYLFFFKKIFTFYKLFNLILFLKVLSN
jgi:hypothetical protein